MVIGKEYGAGVRYRKMKRIHIVGSGPRTGTTLLAEVMVACFDIDHSCEHEASICTNPPKSGNCFLTKHPGEIGSVRLPLKLDSDLYVLCMIRDPRDSVVSFHGLRPDVYWTGLRFWKLFTRKYDELKGHARFIVVKYEELASNPDAVQKEIMERIPFLEKKHDFRKFHMHAHPGESSLEAMKELRPISPNGVGAWKQHLARVKQQISIHGDISDELIRFGYEKDREWLKIINDVKDAHFESARPEFLGWRFYYREKRTEYTEVANILARSAGLDPVVVFAPVRWTAILIRYVFRVPRKVAKKFAKLKGRYHG